jgi:hypothetical protein
LADREVPDDLAVNPREWRCVDELWRDVRLVGAKHNHACLGKWGPVDLRGQSDIIVAYREVWIKVGFVDVTDDLESDLGRAGSHIGEGPGGRLCGFVEGRAGVAGDGVYR